MKKEIVSLVFSVDNNSLPFFGVTLKSISSTCDKKRIYDIYVLHAGLDVQKQKRAKQDLPLNFNLQFVDVSEQLKKEECAILKNYGQTKTNFFKIFAAQMFENLDKVLYLDSDLVVLEDISKLFDTKIKDKLVGAVMDLSVENSKKETEDVEKAYNIDPSRYFNTGVLLMNLKQMRKINFQQRYLKTLQDLDSVISPEQDCFNVVCKYQVSYIDFYWNVMPIEDVCPDDEVKLINYSNLWKPWICEKTKYSKQFWDAAFGSQYYEDVLNIKLKYANNFVC